MKIVSACLAGKHCRYDGKSNEIKEIVNMIRNGEAIAVCPEELGGLSTPRKPSEIQGNRVVQIDGKDVTKAFRQGAEKAFSIAKENNVTEAILQSRSPSCGYGKIYDGTFSKTLIDGDGVFTQLLIAEKISIRSES